MMISEKDKEAFVWVWLPGQTEPVVAGKLEADGDRLLFNYGKSYLERIGATPSAISLFEPELPLIKGLQSPPEGLAMPGCIRDAAPDAWGRRVIINKQLGLKGADVDPAYLNELTYLLESGSDRIGALDFQRSATEYRPRAAQNATLAELQASAERVEKGALRGASPACQVNQQRRASHRKVRPQTHAERMAQKAADFSADHTWLG